MTAEKIKIPFALQLCLDDVAWHNGDDLRYKGQASRSGIPRYHSVEDYQVLEAIGEALDMRIVCPLCLADWDKDNILRGEVGVTHNPRGWDRASEINMEYAEACMAEMRKSKYMDFAYHGLLHGRYDENGKLLTETEYFSMERVNGKAVYSVDAEDVRHRLDLFDKIRHSWGLDHKITTFVSPCGACGATPEQMHVISEEVARRGVRTWMNMGFAFEDAIYTSDGVVCMKKGGNFNGKSVPWDAYDFDPKYLGDFTCTDKKTLSGAFGLHWTNFLRFNPENNFEKAPAWVDYLKRQAEIFGLMLSKDATFSASQAFYAIYSTVTETDGGAVIDVSEARAKAPTWVESSFYVSIAKERAPKGVEGGSVELYEEHKDFNTYKVRFDSDRIVIK